MPGRDIWFNSTFGDEAYYAILAKLPDPTKRIDIGLNNVISTPRSLRFDTWGTINDPDCQANPAGGIDICSDPAATGVVGLRKAAQADGSFLVGISCAACHAGFDPLNPPTDPNEPTWNNIHPTIGNQYGKFGAIFAANLPNGDSRIFMFNAWPRGTVDTTLLESDNITDPGTVTAFWEQKSRNRFNVGTGLPQLRSGQGGEDDLGGAVAAARVYTNIGVCFSECTFPSIASGQPLDVQACRSRCPNFPNVAQINDLTEYMATIRRPAYPELPADRAQYVQGAQVFAGTCQSCHDNRGTLQRVLSNDQVIPLNADPANTPNACRALTTNWEQNHIWANFSSDNYKARVATSQKGYRVMPLGGIWATEPFFHNQSIGDWAPPSSTPQQRAEYFKAAMLDLLSPSRTPKINTLPVLLGPFPAGTPLTYVFSRDPNGNLLCDDPVENHGHYYGSQLSDADKNALIYWLLYQ